jgi:hypothetical protein
MSATTANPTTTGATKPMPLSISSEAPQFDGRNVREFIAQVKDCATRAGI